MRVLLAPGGLWPEPAGVPLAGSGSGLASGRVASCLACGWRAARPHDSLTLLPMVDGGPGSAQVIASDQVASREVIQGRGPLGQVREVDLVRLGSQALTIREPAPRRGEHLVLGRRPSPGASL